MSTKKYNLIVPLAGKGQRMIDGGYSLPKPMLICGHKSILEWSMDSIDYSECNLIFVVRNEHKVNFAIDEWLRHKFGNDISVKPLVNATKGATETVYYGLQTENLDLPLIVYCPDTTFEPIYKPCDADFKNDGLILTFKANSPNYSYLAMDRNGTDVLFTREKEVVSDLASVGVYCFKNGHMFKKYADIYLNEANKEHHICPLYNSIIGNGIVKQRSVDKIHIMGTPQEFKFFENVSYKYFLPRRFAICCDHSGYDLKLEVKRYLDKTRQGCYIDFGCFSKKDCDYNLYVNMAAKYTLNNKDTFGIGICRSGQGINICANKYQGIRACLIQDEYHARYAIKHNAGNFFSLSANELMENRYVLWDILNILCDETFDGGRHQNRMMNND